MGRILIGVIVFAMILCAGVIWTATPGTKDAYAAAEARILAAQEDGDRIIRFNDLANLGELPPELAEMTDLIQVDLRGTAVRDITLLQRLPNLRILSLRGTLVEDLSPLKALENLDTLDISQTWVRDLTPLTELPLLRRLDIGNTWTSSLEPATRMPALDWINMHDAFSSDGSKVHYDTLQSKGVTENNGRSFQQDYRPGYLVLVKLRFERLIRRVRLGLNAVD